MKARHHASGETTVTYAPPPVPGHELAPGAVDLAFSAVCHFCEVTHISVLRAFPIPYRCSACAAAQRTLPPPPAPKLEPETLTAAQTVLLARIEKITERITEFGNRIAAERVRRDDLFVKGQAQGLSTRRLAVPAQMTSPGVCSAIARAKERASTKEET